MQKDFENNGECTEVTPLYVSRVVLNAADIVAWAKGLGLTDLLDPRHLHVTVLYSKTAVAINLIQPRENHLKVEMRGAVPFRISSSLALPIKDTRLISEHTRFLNAGASHDYADGIYRPHVSLKYNPTEDEVARAVENSGFSGAVELGPEK